MHPGRNDIIFGGMDVPRSFMATHLVKILSKNGTLEFPAPLAHFFLANWGNGGEGFLFISFTFASICFPSLCSEPQWPFGATVATVQDDAVPALQEHI